MKKAVVALMTVVMLLASGLALADGILYNGDIQFGNYNFGMTFEELKGQEFINYIFYKHTITPSRVVGEARGEAIGNLYWMDDEKGLLSMQVSLEQRTVAQHENVQTELYFNVPIVDGVPQKEESAAVLTAGKYIFYDDAKATFKDLTEKLTGVYGDPFLKTSKGNDIWGELVIPESMNWLKTDQSMKEQSYNPSYVVWKSATNNVMVILATAKIWGSQQTYLAYVDARADAALLAYMEGASGVSLTEDTSSSGL